MCVHFSSNHTITNTYFITTSCATLMQVALVGRRCLRAPQSYLRAGAADLADVAVVDLGGLGWLFGLQLLVLEGRLLGEGVACPGGSCCRRRHCLLLLLLLLLLLVV